MSTDSYAISSASESQDAEMGETMVLEGPIKYKSMGAFYLCSIQYQNLCQRNGKLRFTVPSKEVKWHSTVTVKRLAAVEGILVSPLVDIQDSPPEVIRDSKQVDIRDNPVRATQDSQQAGTQDNPVRATQDSQQAGTQDNPVRATQDSQQAGTQDNPVRATQDSQQAGTQDSQQAGTQDNPVQDSQQAGTQDNNPQDNILAMVVSNHGVIHVSISRSMISRSVYRSSGGGVVGGMVNCLRAWP
eukprot:Em0005g1315a